MNPELRKILKFVVLSNEAPSEYRATALDLLLDETGADAGPNIQIHFNGARLYYPIDRETYDHISNELRDAHKINAIKLLRVYYQGRTGTLLGLKDAKDTVDNWTFGM